MQALALELARDAGYELRAMSYELRALGRNYGLRALAVSYEWGYELTSTSSELRATSCELRATSTEL